MPCFLSRCARQVVPMWFYFINGISTSNFKYNPQSLIIYLPEILLFLIQLFQKNEYLFYVDVNLRCLISITYTALYSIIEALICAKLF